MKNLREIADELGVAPSTVSTVLNSKKGVGDALRNKITEVLLENGYTIRSDKPESIVVEFIYFRNEEYVEDHHDDTFGSLLSGAEPLLRKNFADCIVVRTDEKTLGEEIRRVNSDSKVRGILFMGTEYLGDSSSHLESCGKPVVVMDSSFDTAPVNTVDMNNAEGMSHLFSCISENGHCRIGYVRSRMAHGCMRVRQEQAAIQAKRFGVEIDPDVSGEVSQLSSRIDGEMEEYVRNLPYLPTAILADNDFIALSLIKALWERGCRIPDDVSVLGFDDSPLSKYLVPRLTTVKADFQEIGRVAAERLLELIHGADDVRKVYISAPFVPGSSVAPCDKAGK